MSDCTLITSSQARCAHFFATEVAIFFQLVRGSPVRYHDPTLAVNCAQVSFLLTAGIAHEPCLARAFTSLAVTCAMATDDRAVSCALELAGMADDKCLFALAVSIIATHTLTIADLAVCPGAVDLTPIASNSIFCVAFASACLEAAPRRCRTLLRTGASGFATTGLTVVHRALHVTCCANPARLALADAIRVDALAMTVTRAHLVVRAKGTLLVTAGSTHISRFARAHGLR